MRLTRNKTPDGKCKYALVRLDKIRKLTELDKSTHHEPREYSETVASRTATALSLLEGLGLLEYGERGTEEECFVIKLKDRFAAPALRAYADAASSDPEYRWDVLELAERAETHPSKKRPD